MKTKGYKTPYWAMRIYHKKDCLSILELLEHPFLEMDNKTTGEIRSQIVAEYMGWA